MKKGIETGWRNRCGKGKDEKRRMLPLPSSRLDIIGYVSTGGDRKSLMTEKLKVLGGKQDGTADSKVNFRAIRN